MTKYVATQATRITTMNRGDVISLGLERFRFNTSEAGVEDAITSEVNLMAARVI